MKKLNITRLNPRKKPRRYSIRYQMQEVGAITQTEDGYDVRFIDSVPERDYCRVYEIGTYPTRRAAVAAFRANVKFKK